MVCTNSSENLARRNSSFRIGFHRVVDRNNLFIQPSLNRRVPLLQGTKTRANDLASRGIAAGRDLPVDELRLFFEQSRPGPIDRLINVITDRRFETEVIELTPEIPTFFSEIISRLSQGEGPGPVLVTRESTDRSDLKTTRCLTATLVGISLIVAGLGMDLGIASILSMLTVAALLFSFSLREARQR